MSEIVYCEPCGTILPPDATACPVCTQDAADFAAELAAAPTVHIRIVRCRYLRRSGNACTAEAADVTGEVLLCTEHLALALELINRRSAA